MSSLQNKRGAVPLYFFFRLLPVLDGGLERKSSPNKKKAPTLLGRRKEITS